jgi:hypothetical protein
VRDSKKRANVRLARRLLLVLEVLRIVAILVSFVALRVALVATVAYGAAIALG